MASRAERPIIPSKKSLADAYMALKATLENKLSPYFEDYGQLIEPGSPLNNDYQNLKQRVSRHIPSNEDFRNPKSMSEWSQAAALNAPMGLSTKLPPTKYSKAHDIARRKAALRPDHRGLGLPPDNTAMDRAEALGFDTDVYHGTQNSDLIENELIPGGSNGAKTNGDAYGLGVYTSTSPHAASGYAKGDNAAVYPLLVNRQKYLNIDYPTQQDYENLSKYAGETMLPSDKAMFDGGKKIKEFEDLQAARDFFAERRKDWEQFGGGYDRARPEAILGEDGIPKVEYTDFFGEVPINNPEDAFTLMHSAGWDNIPSMGYEGHTMLRNKNEDWDITRNTKNLRSRFAAFDPWNQFIFY